MNYLIDSNVISELYDTSATNHANISRKLNNLSNNDRVFVSIITLYELEYAYCNAPIEKSEIIRNDIIHVRKNFDIAALSLLSSEIFGRLKKQYKDEFMINKENIKKHNIDIMLASQAIDRQCILVSGDKIYQTLKKMDNRLNNEDWTVY
jgi:predicted nucleic acid-binding protein